MKNKKIVLFILLSINISIFCQDVLEIPPTDDTEKICFALYTVHNKILKLTAQFYPLSDWDPFEATLEKKENEKWIEIDKKPIDYPGLTVRFRVEDWNDKLDIEYRVNHNNKAYYKGIIKKNPIDKDKIIVCAFTGNSVWRLVNGDYITDDRSDIVENVKKINPDLLFFSGDQVYNHSRHYNAWLKFGRDYGEIISNIPTICIPDDHDIGQGNLWGQNGKISKSRAGSDGGYYMPVEYIKEVERAQTSHLPDPFDPTPIERGIGVYYTSLNIGGIDFAIIEDRKFKTGPEGLVPQKGSRPDHYSTTDYDPNSLDVPEAVLLGERQLKFLENWGKNWNNVYMKAVLSQTIFAGGAHIHGKIGGRLYADLDANGWPQTGRNLALQKIRKSFAVMIAGDQHLATVIQHGIDEWNDAGYSFCVPSISNYYLRWWNPLEEGKNRKLNSPLYTGEFLDGFDNKLTLHSVANPEGIDPNNSNKRGEGFGVVTFDKIKREIKFECFKRDINIENMDSQYPGWPLTISQFENFGSNEKLYLPTIYCNINDPVLQIIDEHSNEVIFTVRIKGKIYQPRVNKDGIYTIRLGEPEVNNWIEIKSVSPSKTSNNEKININL